MHPFLDLNIFSKLSGVKNATNWTALHRKKVGIYVGEDHQRHGRPDYSAILDFLLGRDAWGASVTRGVAGFGSSCVNLFATFVEV